MKNPSNIAHPLKNRTGTSQKNRAIQALGADQAPIDGKTLADRLYLISQYARQINFYQYKITEIDGASQELDNWSVFFKDSLPFQLTILCKTSIDDLERQFSFLYDELQANPSKQSLESLFNFIFNKIFKPTTLLFKTVQKEENSFTESLLAIIKMEFSEAIKSFICLHNASANFLCVTKKDFNDFLNTPWELKVDQIYALDLCIVQVEKGKKEAFLKAGEVLSTIFQQVLSGIQSIVTAAPEYIDESLLPLKESLQKKHEPHLALLFAFLELFTHFQGNINELTKKHLDFFYEQVLKMIPKDAVSDKAHIVFEVANHKEHYLIKKDLLLKDGKDSNKQDIQFGLEHEIVLDKAQIKDLRTLYLNPIKTEDEKYIEGVFIAPVANSADGKGEKFKEEQPKNWPTLGSKYTKNIKEIKVEEEKNSKSPEVKCIEIENEIYEEHPKARLGFVLASPVLLLQEGKRTINIVLDCKFEIKGGENEAEVLAEMKKVIDCYLEETNIYDLTRIIEGNFTDLLDDIDEVDNVVKKGLNEFFKKRPINKILENELITFLETKNPDGFEIFIESLKTKVLNFFGGLTKKNIRVFKEPIFKFKFSGEKEWLEPKSEIFIVEPSLLNDKISFDIEILLEDDFPAVVFYNEEKLKEKIDLKEPFPLVKIELNEEASIDCIFGEPDDKKNCCLKKTKKSGTPINLSPYHFLQKLILEDAHIDVKVCGVKNLIVQNDENLQDVNKPMFPFGPRPKVDAAFVIGSKEVFCKNWQSFRLGVEWKDRPEDFEDYYEAYNLDDDVNINNDVFLMEANVLDDAQWNKDSNPEKEIFTTRDAFSSCPPIINTEEEFNFNGYAWSRGDFSLDPYSAKSMPIDPLFPLTVNSRKAFFRIRLKGEDFQHDSYAFVLAKQMMALANIIDAKSAERVRDDLRLLQLLSDWALALIASILTRVNFVVGHIDVLNDTEIPGLLTLAQSIHNHLDFVNNNYNHASSPGEVTSALGDVNSIIDEIDEIGAIAGTSSIFGQLDHIKGDLDRIKGFIEDNPGLPFNTKSISDDNVDNNLNDYGLQIVLVDIERRIIRVTDLLDVDKDVKLPNEPYTPTLKSIFVDYHAIATKEDMDIIHLYPYENTSKFEAIESNPTLFPYFDDEGTLFIGLDKITKGGSLSMLFQLAEATANSELDRAKINWVYLRNNEWEPLEYDFDVISDETDGFTVSGIATVAIPNDINNIGNTVMPDPLYWIKVSAPENVKAVAETIGIHTQAAKTSARFSELSDKSRLDNALASGSIAKLVEGDFNVKKVEQLYPSFGGRTPEADGHFYTRVSEHLKHKGRAALLNDYEKIVLEGFPEIYKAKCITHTMGLSAITYHRDLEIAPGYVVVTVIPDLTKLEAGNLQEPKVPVSLLEKVGDYIRKRTSPFARLKVMNPRFEYINVDITVQLYRGKSDSFYKQKLKEELHLFLAPWSLGDSEKLAFGQVVLFSDIVGFVEKLAYVDFISDLKLSGSCNQTGSIIKPLTARSVLTGGKICVETNKEKCEDKQDPVIMIN